MEKGNERGEKKNPVNNGKEGAMGLKNRSAQFVFAMLCWRVGLSTAGEEDRQRPLAAVEGATSARSRYRFVSRVVLLFLRFGVVGGLPFFFSSVLSVVLA